jgi:hypothetical protein
LMNRLLVGSASAERITQRTWRLPLQGYPLWARLFQAKASAQPPNPVVGLP